MIKCPLGCNKDKEFQRGGLKEHLKVCELMCDTCMTCDSEVFMKDKSTHNCLLALKSALSRKNEVIESL